MTEQRVATGNEQDRPVPLMQAIGIAIAEFEQAPRARERSDYPYMVAYFRSENSLVMLQRNRPIKHAFQPVETHLDGYFAEAFDIDEHGHVNPGVSDPSVLNELFRRVEVTDESDDPSHGPARLTPTRFPSISREFFGKTFENQPQALPGTTDEKGGTLGQLFAQQQIRDADRFRSDEARINIREVIMGRYFNFGETQQGFSRGVGDEHFVITDDEQSSLVAASKALGVKTHIIKPDESWHSSDNPLNHFEALRDSRGLLPMLISFQGEKFHSSLGSSVRVEAKSYARRFPLFAFIDFSRKTLWDQTAIIRVHPGWYQAFGENPEGIRKLIMKIGVDYMLTTKVRQLAQGLS